MNTSYRQLSPFFSSLTIKTAANQQQNVFRTEMIENTNSVRKGCLAVQIYDISMKLTRHSLSGRFQFPNSYSKLNRISNQFLEIRNQFWFWTRSSSSTRMTATTAAWTALGETHTNNDPDIRVANWFGEQTSRSAFPKTAIPKMDCFCRRIWCFGLLRPEFIFGNIRSN